MKKFTEEEAFAAVRAFEKMAVQLEAFARYITGNNKLTIRAHASETATTGNVMYIRPPLGLGVNRQHDRLLCDRRDADDRLICDACDKREVIEFQLYHEIAHVAFKSTRIHGSVARKAFEDYLGVWHDPAVCNHAIAVTSQRHGRMSCQELAHLVNVYMPTIANAFEGTRVNSLMFKSRPGLREIFAAQYQRIMTEDTDLHGQTFSLVTESTDSQFIVGAMIKSMGYSTDGLIVPSVESSLSEIIDLTSQGLGAKTPDDAFKLAVELFEAGHRLGYLQEVQPCVPAPPPPPEMPSLEAEPGDTGGEPEGDENDEDDDHSGPGEDSDPAAEDDAPGGSSGEPSDDEVPGEGADPIEASTDSPGEDDDGVVDPDTQSDGSHSPVAEEPEPGDSDSEEDSSGLTGVGHETESQDAPDSRDGGESSGDSASSEVAGSSEEVSDESGDGQTGGGSRNDESSPEDDGDSRVSSSALAEGESDSPDGADDGMEEWERELLEGLAEEKYSENAWDAKPPEALPGDDLSSGVFDPTSGTESAETAPTLPSGTPADVDQAMGRYGAHAIMDSLAGDESLDDITGSPEGEELPRRLYDMLASAIAQANAFDNRSDKINGIDHIPWPVKKSWHKWDRADVATVDSYMPAPGVLSRSILVTREAFDDNRRAKANKNITSGRIVPSVLGRRAPIQDERLFGKRILPKRRSYFVQIVLDCSNSTNSNNVQMKMKRMAFMQAEILHALRIPFAIFGHTAFDEFNNPGSGHMTMYVQTIKERNEAWGPEQKSKLAGLHGVAWNLDGHAMEYARKQVEKGNDTDSIILYYSDGAMPSYNVDEEKEILRSEIARCKKNGVTLLGVGINTDSPSRHGMSTVRVDEDRDIIKVAEQLVTALTKKG